MAQRHRDPMEKLARRRVTPATDPDAPKPKRTYRNLWTRSPDLLCLILDTFHGSLSPPELGAGLNHVPIFRAQINAHSFIIVHTPDLFRSNVW
jgi:hypothetical protein